MKETKRNNLILWGLPSLIWMIGLVLFFILWLFELPNCPSFILMGIGIGMTIGNTLMRKFLTRWMNDKLLEIAERYEQDAWEVK